MTELQGLIEVSVGDLQKWATGVRAEIAYRLDRKQDKHIAKARERLTRRGLWRKLLRLPAPTYTDEEILSLLTKASFWSDPLYGYGWAMHVERCKYRPVVSCLRAAESGDPASLAYLPFPLITLIHQLWLDYTARMQIDH